MYNRNANIKFLCVGFLWLILLSFTDRSVSYFSHIKEILRIVGQGQYQSISNGGGYDYENANVCL